MRYLVLTVLFLSCSIFRSHDQGAAGSADLKVVQQIARTYTGLIGDPYSLVDRCDSLTYAGHYNAAAKVIDIYKHEYEANADGTKTYSQGWIHRSKEICNDGSGTHQDSRSECSKENVLAWFHNLITLKDTAGIIRTIRHARDNDWYFCHGGDESYNRMVEFAPLLNDWEKKLTSSLTLAEEADALAIPKLEGYRGNVLASYILLKGRAFGYINTVEKEALKSLIATEPTSPLFRAIYHRFTDGDQEEALSMLLKPYFLRTSLPVGESPFAWGDAPESALLYVWTAGVLSGI